MENRKILTSTILPVSIIVLAVLIRVAPHAPNFTPIAAIALFGGVYLNKKLAIVIPLLAMLISDFFLGFHASMPYVYLSLILTGLIGMWVKHHKMPVTVFSASLASSVLFFLITNYGFWLTDSLYPKTAAGQLTAYYMALPFFRNTLVGDLFYTTLLFGGYELVKHFVQKTLLLKKL